MIVTFTAQVSGEPGPGHSRAGQRTDLELLLAVNLRSAYSLYAVLRLPQPSSEQTSVTPLRRGIAERATGPVTAPEHVDSRRF